MREIRTWFLALGITISLTGCTQEDGKAEVKPDSTVITEQTVDSEMIEISEESEEKGECSRVLGEISAFLGMYDSETKDMFGGGKENWTEDRSFYIGRIFQTELYGENCSVYTTCSEEGKVDSISIKIVNGERPVTEEEIQKWTDRISDETDSEFTEDDNVSKSRNRQRVWRKDGKIVTMNYAEMSLTIHFQKTIGELK
ncbi:MAG: hypothetical protein ACLUFH_12370 [Monoglobales bacterium]